MFRRKKSRSKLVTIKYGVRSNPHKTKIEQAIDKATEQGYVLAQRQDIPKKRKTELTFVLADVEPEAEVEAQSTSVKKRKGKPVEPAKPEHVVLGLASFILAVVLLVMLFSGGDDNSSSKALPTVAELPTEVLDSELTLVAAMSVIPSGTPEPTATITDTPMPSATPLPTATVSPEELVMAAVEDAVTADREDIEQLIVNERVVTLRFPLNNVSAGWALDEAELMFPQLVCNLRDAGFIDRTYQITGTIGVVDSFGNTSQAEGVEMILPWSATEQINCENIYNVNLAVIAERWTVSPLLQE